MDEAEQLKQRIQQLEQELAQNRENFKGKLKDLLRFLVPIKGFIGTLREDAHEEWYTLEDRHEFYQIIEANVDRMKHDIEAYLNGSLTPEETLFQMHYGEIVNVIDLIRGVVQVQQERTSKHVLVLEFETEPVSMEADAHKLAEIVHNLVSTAIVSTPQGGNIRIVVRGEPISETYPDGALLIQVIDPGMGLTTRQLKYYNSGDYARPRFVRHSSRSGTLIGCRLVGALIELHHGNLLVESDGEGKGSAFSVRIPLKQPPSCQEVEN